MFAAQNMRCHPQQIVFGKGACPALITAPPPPTPSGQKK